MVLSLRNPVYFDTAYLNLDTKFSLEILVLFLDSISSTVEEGDLHTQVVPNILKFFFPTTTKSNTSFYILN